MRILPLLLLALASLSCFGQNTSVQTDKKTTREQLDIKGNFGPELKNGLPEGWIPPVGVSFDDSGKISMNKIPRTEKNALHVTAQTKAMRFTFDKKWPVASGDKCVISAIVRGNGGIDLGAFYFPRTNLLPAPLKGFLANGQWTEFTTEILIPKINPEINEIVIVMGASFGASVEFAEVRAEIIKKEEPKTTGAALNAPDNTLPVSDRLWKIANVREAFLIDRQADENIRQFLELKQQAKKMLEGNDLSGAPELIRKYDKQVEEVREPAKRIVVAIQNRHAIPELYIHGKEVRVSSGKYSATIKEGLNIIGLKVKVNGQTPGMRISIPGQPELESRWRVGTATDDSWLKEAFDDRAWKQAQIDKDGYLIVPEGSAGTVCFRQIILWGDNHYSGLPSIQPKVREWGFSEKGMETLFHVLYSPQPLTFALEDYELILDVPRGFTLLREKYADNSKGTKLNRRPRNVTEEVTKHENQPYTRYRFSFEPDFVQPVNSENNNQATMIPLLLGEYKGADKLCNFYFRRLASGNLTELEQTLPVRILPPINGRMPKKVMLSQYTLPWWSTEFFPEQLKAHVHQSLNAGLNLWSIHAVAGEYAKKVYDQVIERGGLILLQPAWNYPHLTVLPQSAFGKLM
ncbi:MAG: hypothetical protein M0Q53_20680, partial [Prolixibacteraceae bacterium]|nr:hypothetical protein [Prolixibacteraceae bacterium]